MSPSRRREMVDREHPSLPIVGQCALLGVEPLQHILPSQGGFGRGPVADAGDRPAVPGNPLLWVAADEGLAGAAGYTGEPEAGAAADAGPWGCGPSTGDPEPADRRRECGSIPICWGRPKSPDPTRCGPPTSLTCPWPGGFLYLVAVMDWHSRYVLSWRLSNTLEAGFCAEALVEALVRGGPEVFNTDQGSQFTSPGIHPGPTGPRCEDQHGREGEVRGQHLRRAAVAHGEVRGGVPERPTPARGRPGGNWELTSGSTMTRGSIRHWDTGRRGKCSLRAGRPKMKSQQLGGGRRKQTWYLMRERRDPHLTPP